MASLSIATETVTLHLSKADTQEWAARPGATWPCSFLAGRSLLAIFDETGLCDLSINCGRGSQDCPSDEFNAITADFLQTEMLPKDHPAYFVAVGQFVGGR